MTLITSLGGVRPARADNPAVAVNVDASANRRTINPLVYGVAYADEAALRDLNAPLHRNGGNNTSRYNWQLNADNRGNDWYFQSIAETSAVAGDRGDAFITQSRAGGAEPMLTIPTVGWVAKLGGNRSKLASFSIAKYGAQADNDWQWFPDAGNGVRTNGTNVTGNDPSDANVPADGAFQQGWMQHLATRWGLAGSGGLRYYILDNEPSIWHSTHRDVHPTGATMEEIRDKLIDYGSRVKAVDPGAQVVGPEEWGWSGYLYSGYDQQWGSQHGWSSLPDRNNHQEWDYLPWLLDQLKQRATTTGQRLLDVFTVHYYPQGGEFGNEVGAAMKQRRNRSTRSLWDPNYVDETWIADRVRLIPRLREWVATYYPGTKTGITEYNWGAEGDMNGATAQADVYGIFGREGLDVGARWTTPATNSPTFKAMKMYRNYDGNRSGFGDTSVAAVAPNPDELASFAAVRTTDGALTVMIVGKALTGNTPLTVNLAGFSAGGSAQVWQLASNVLQRAADVTVAAGRFTASIPPQSVTLFVVPAQTLPTLSIGDVVVTEGASGTTQAVFTATLSVASSQTVTASWATADGTATAGTDYASASGTLTFATGVTSRIVSVTVNGDTAVEPDETFFVNLTAPANATLGDGQGRATIPNDDTAALPTLAVSATTVNPGQAVQVTLQNGPGNPRDWLGMHATAAVNTSLLDWKYLNGTRTAPGAGLSSATVTFTAPTVPGTYDFRLFQNNTYTRLATSPTVTVTGGSSGASLSVSTTTATPAQPVQVSVSGGPGTPRDWVALHAQGAADSTYLDWKYLNGTRTAPSLGVSSATLTFIAPSVPGTYEFRFFQNNTYTRLATSPAVSVAAAAGAGLAVSTTTATPGQSVQVTVSGGPGLNRDWVALHAQDAADTSYLDWKYLNGSRTPPGTGLTSATLTFSLPQGPGPYNFRFYRDNTYTKLATSPVVTVVAAGPTATLTLNTTTAAPGGSVQVTVANGPGSPTDWIGLYASGAMDNAYLDWKYLNGTRTAPAAGLTAATVTFTLPQAPGTYELRLFRSNGYTKLATTSTITVQ